MTEIGDLAFNGCYNLKEVYNNSSLNITAGSGSNGYVACYAVEVHNSSESESIFDDESGFAIVDGVLYGYRGSATNIIIPETVTSIARYAFWGNTDIISVSIPAGVTSIGDYAFRDCSSLKSIEIPAGVTSIGNWAFSGCSKLNTVYYNGSIENWFNIESNPLYYGADLYIGGELVTAVVVPESITTIGYQLIGCTSLTSITIHSGVTSIGDYAFYDCSNLESVTFAEGSQLTSIGSSAFRDCISLKSIEIPAGVTSIGSRAFESCRNLESLTFAEGSQLTSIGSSAFYYCSNLETIYYNGTEEQWIAIEKGANWDYNCGNYEVVFLGDAGTEA